MLSAAAAPRPTVPLPAGFGIAFDADTQFVSRDVLFGGSPPRLLRLDPPEVQALEQLRGLPVGSTDSGRLARRLTDAGLAHPRPPAMQHPASVTVVIPVRDRARELDRCLSALGTSYPVIVVDDGSIDPAAVVSACQSHRARLKRYSVAGGPGRARNGGLAMVTTPLVAFLDSDCVARPDWIAGLATHFADPMVGAVAPRVQAVTSQNAAGRYLDARAPIDMGPREARVAPLSRLSYVPTAALLVRREAIGTSGFDPHLPYGEDVDLIWRLIAAGWRVRYDPSAQVSHVEPSRMRHILARRFRYGRSAAPLARRHPGQVPPLILQAWPAAAVAALLARRPLIALGAYGAGICQLERLLRGWNVPARGMLRPMAGSVQQTWLGLGQWGIQYALPAITIGIAWPGGRTRRTRIGRRLALTALLAGPPTAAWLRGRPQLDPVRFALGYLADEVAYGAGVYWGVAAERLPDPLLPRLAWRPLPKATNPGAQAAAAPATKAARRKPSAVVTFLHRTGRSEGSPPTDQTPLPCARRRFRTPSPPRCHGRGPSSGR
jgi:mycofactocin system glycosyltransferase